MALKDNTKDALYLRHRAIQFRLKDLNTYHGHLSLFQQHDKLTLEAELKTIKSKMLLKGMEIPDD